MTRTRDGDYGVIAPGNFCGRIKKSVEQAALEEWNKKICDAIRQQIGA